MTSLDRRPLEESDKDPKQLLREAEQLRRSAFIGVVIGTAAVLTSVIAVPMLYNYMQYVQSSLQEELAFCHHRTEGLWDEYSKVYPTMFIEIFKFAY
jgi:hypothetical protein